MKIFLFLILLLIAPIQSTQAAVGYLHVAKTGNNSNDGSTNSPFLTIAKAESVVTNGLPTNIYVQAGLYEEDFSVNCFGSAGNYVNFIAVGQVVLRRLGASSSSYVRFIGFEITHVDTTTPDGFIFAGAGYKIELIDNYIHDIYATHSGIAFASLASLGEGVFRGNTLSNIGIIPGVATNSPTAGISSQAGTNSFRWLVEYNNIFRSGDATILRGTNHIVRNNVMGDYNNSYWGLTSDVFHADIAQNGSNGADAQLRNQVWEANFCFNQVQTNGHGFLMQDTDAGGDTNVLIRGNIFANMGSGAIANITVDSMNVYQNTFYSINTFNSAGSPPTVNFRQWVPTSEGVTNSLLIGNIFDNTGSASTNLPGMTIEANCYVQNAINMGYKVSSSTSYVSNDDPLFVDALNRDFHLQASSPAIATGTNVIWITSADGSGTSFDVNNGQLLCDGFGITSGDLILVNGASRRITAISENTVTVSASVTWTENMPVYWGTDATPDIGGVQYGATDLTVATMIQSGSTYTVTPTGECRGVWFYESGVPVSWDDTAPYTYTSGSGGVVAKAYALHVQLNPVVTATLTVISTPVFVISGSVNVSGSVIIQ